MSPLKLKTEAQRREEEKRGKEIGEKLGKRLLAAYARLQQDQIEREARIRARTQTLLRESTVLPIPQIPAGKGPQTKKVIAILWTWPAADLGMNRKLLCERLKSVAGRSTILDALQIVIEARGLKV